jgi:hypothetical protein
MAEFVKNRKSLTPWTDAAFVVDDRPPYDGIVQRVERALKVWDGAALDRSEIGSDWNQVAERSGAIASTSTGNRVSPATARE